MAYSAELADRIREALSGGPPVREVRMFGGLAFLVDEKMALTAHNGGGMLLRVDPDRVEEFLGKGAEVAVMGGRQMSAGWIVVRPEQIDSDADFAYWVRAALDHNESAPRSRGRRRGR